MALGHIQLGAPGDLRDYMLVDYRQYHRSPANPLAGKVQTGGRYADLEGWSEFVQEDWQAGLGQANPDAGGYMYGEVDARVPGQVILSQALGASWLVSAVSARPGRLPYEASQFSWQTIGPAETYTKVAFPVDSANVGGLPAIGKVWLLAAIPAGCTVTVQICRDSATNPGTVLDTFTFTPNNGDPYPGWYYGYSTVPATLTPAGLYWIVFTPAARIEVPTGTTGGGYARWYTAGAWTTPGSGDFPFVMCDAYNHIAPYASFFDFVRVSTTKVLAFGTSGGSPENLYTFEYSSTPNQFALQGTDTLAAAVARNPVAYFADLVWVPGHSTQYVTVNPTTNARTIVAAGGTLFVAAGGYLWRAVGTQVYYTADGTTWTGPIPVCQSPNQIRGMAALDQYMYCACDDGLYYVGPGDQAAAVVPWAQPSATNGVGMISHQGALFIPADGRLYRYGADGSIADIWQDRQEDMPAGRVGRVVRLASSNSGLVAAVAGQNITGGTPINGRCSLLTWSSQGWQHLGALPEKLVPSAVRYDRTLQRLWVGSDQPFVMFANMLDYTVNPYYDTGSKFMPCGWLELPRVVGGLLKLNKDWESVFLSGIFAAGQAVDIYYCSDQAPAWTLLGTVTADGTELRWSNYATRPTGKWLRLGLRLRTTDRALTPRLQAVVLKFLPMTNDRWQWNLPVAVTEQQEMLDGSLNVQTMAQMVTHVESLIKRVAPFWLADLDGRQFEVKVAGSAVQCTKLLVQPDGTRELEWVYVLALEQVNDVA